MTTGNDRSNAAREARLRHLDGAAVWARLLRWLKQPLIDGSPWTLRLRHYATFLLLIALSSPFSHAYLGIALSPAEAAVHAAIVVACAAAAIAAIEGLTAALRGRSGPREPVSTGGFIARAVFAYALSAPAVGLVHALSPYTRAIMAKHTGTGQVSLFWGLFPVALPIVYVAYQMMRKDDLARQVAALQQINDELAAAQRERRDEGTRCGDAPRPASCVIRVQSKGVETPLPAERVVRIQADENYCHVVPDAGTSGTAKSHLVRMTLKEARDAVPAQLFVQTHRSHLVNLDYVTELRRDGRRRELRLGNGDRVPVSRSRADAVESRIREYLIAATVHPNPRARPHPRGASARSADP